MLGMDPIWSLASNEIAFVNGIKMKFAVIMGVVHMCLGITMKGVNAIYFKSKLDFWFEFVPQIVKFLLI